MAFGAWTNSSMLLQLHKGQFSLLADLQRDKEFLSYFFLSEKQICGKKTPTLSSIHDNRQCILGKQSVYCFFLNTRGWSLKAKQRHSQFLDKCLWFFFNPEGIFWILLPLDFIFIWKLRLFCELRKMVIIEFVGDIPQSQEQYWRRS